MKLQRAVTVNGFSSNDSGHSVTAPRSLASTMGGLTVTVPASEAP